MSNNYNKLLASCAQRCAQCSVIFPAMLLSSCAQHTDSAVKIEYVYPPKIINLCDKPEIFGTFPEIVTNDIPNLKRALSECAQQAEDYLIWIKKAGDR